MGNLLFPYNAEDRNDQKFQHRYFVDGPVTVSDARIGGSWATVLVGTSGAGGRSVFGIDVTTPGAVNSSSVRWEISDTVTATSNGIQVGAQIGHVLGKPAVVPVKTAGGGVSWKAIFGNGYGSDRGRATLFVVDMATGTASTIEAVETAGPGVPTEPNGLGNIIVLDRQLYSEGTFSTGSDGFADTVYAGDLHGNIWKFDITSTAGSVAYGGQPFFTAKDADGKRQPVTGGLEAVAGPANGVMILFGTGSFWFTADAANDDIQSVYGVVDKGVRVTADRTVALQQQVLRNVGADEDVREITPAVVNFASKSGWFMDLAVQFGTDDPVKRGERMVGRPRIQAGTLFFPTYEPDSSDECATAGENWLYALNALTGAPDMDSVRPGSPDADALPSGSAASKLDTDAESPVMDVVTLASPPLADLPADASDEDLDNYLDKTCDLIVQAAGSEPLYQIRACGRQSWRQVR
jgi:type IV pilus assembly protein PilY1